MHSICTDSPPPPLPPYAFPRTTCPPRIPPLSLPWTLCDRFESDVLQGFKVLMLLRTPARAGELTAHTGAYVSCFIPTLPRDVMEYGCIYVWPGS